MRRHTATVIAPNGSCFAPDVFVDRLGTDCLVRDDTGQRVGVIVDVSIAEDQRSVIFTVEESEPEDFDEFLRETDPRLVVEMQPGETLPATRHVCICTCGARFSVTTDRATVEVIEAIRAAGHAHDESDR